MPTGGLAIACAYRWTGYSLCLQVDWLELVPTGGLARASAYRWTGYSLCLQVDWLELVPTGGLAIASANDRNAIWCFRMALQRSATLVDVLEWCFAQT